ncbi:MAG: type II toxin-antitoxin system HicB family antitoxin, partial [Alphaproteobacteria bacterium]
MNPNYIGLIRKQDDSDFSVEFPDFPGCVTAAASLDEAQAMAEEALQFHIDGMVQDRLPIPAPSSLDAIMADPEQREAIPFLVRVRPPKGKAVRVNVTFDEYLLAAIDALAAAKRMSRSGL